MISTKVFGVMMKKYNIIERKTGHLLITITIYEKKLVKPLLFQFKKQKQINVVEVEQCEEKI